MFASFRRRVESTHFYTYNINVDFMFASTRSFVSTKRTSKQHLLLLPPLLFFVFFGCSFFLFFFFVFVFFLFFFLLLFFTFFFLLYYERTNASVGTDDSPLLLLLFFDDGDDSRNVVFCRIHCRFFSFWTALITIPVFRVCLLPPPTISLLLSLTIKDKCMQC